MWSPNSKSLNPFVNPLKISLDKLRIPPISAKIKIMIKNVNQNMCFIFLIIPKYNIKFLGSQARGHLPWILHMFSMRMVYTYILLYREVWRARGVGVTDPQPSYTPFPYIWSHTLLDLYIYIFISIYCVTLVPPFVTRLFSLPVSPTWSSACSSYLFFLLVPPITVYSLSQIYIQT